MNRKTFKEPDIPRNLQEIKDGAGVIEAAREDENRISQSRFDGFFITDLDGSGIIFEKTIFKNCRFIGCRFDKTSFMDVAFINCDLSNSSFENGYFKYCSFQDSKALGADFYGSRFLHVSFERCCMQETGMNACRLSYIKAFHTDFKCAGFSMCKIGNIEWKDCCLAGVNFFKTLLRDIDFTGCDIRELVLSDDRRELSGAIVDMGQALVLAKGLGIVIKEFE